MDKAGQADSGTAAKRNAPGANATIRSVARQAGVSIATVSRFINHKGNVSADVAERLARTMAELDYVPNTSARNLASNKTWAIGLLVDNISGDFFTPLLKGIESEAGDADYALFTATSARWKHVPGRQPPLGPHNADGVLVFADSLPNPWVEQWNRAGFPMVILQQEPPANCSIPCVQVENTLAVIEAVTHLIQAHGRRRIAFLRGHPGQKDAAERETGYRAALGAAGLAADPSLLLEGNFDADVAARAVGAALDAGLRFDALCAADDYSAIGALRALQSRGMRVPQDVSLIGFDDQHYCQLLDPPLTTIRAQTENVGRVGTRALLALLRGETPAPRVVLPSQVMYRRTCGCE